MEKKKPYGETPKQQLRAAARDRLYTFRMAADTIRGAIVNGTRMINEMRANHDLGILETLVLGRAYLGAALMTTGLKGQDRLGLEIKCSGPIKGLVVEANAFGEVRGYLKRVPIAIDSPLEDFNLSPFFGAGFLSVMRHLEHARQPFTGTVVLKYGNVAQDLAHYCVESEQIPSAFNLSIKFDRQGRVTGAGGLVLQAMPGAHERITGDLEDRVVRLPSLGAVLAEKTDPRDLVRRVFKRYEPKFLEDHRIEFICHCSRERVRNMIMMLPIDDLYDIHQKGPFPLEIKCHHCNTPYLFDKKEIRALYGARQPDN